MESIGADRPRHGSQTKERRVANWRQYVWDNWWNGNGHCEDCPIRCENQGFNPDFGAFNYNADLMIVGLEPGQGGKYGEDGSGRGRTRRTMPSDDADSPRLIEDRDYEYKILHQWDFFGDLLRLFGLYKLKENDNRTYPPDRTYVPLYPEEVYYTNSLKCAKLADSAAGKDGVDDPSRDNKNARKECRGYLKEEIELVDPDAIVAFGGESWKSIVSALRIEDEVADANKLMQNINTGPEASFNAFSKDPTVIPAVHWANPQREQDDLPIEGGSGFYDRYFSGLAECINNELGITPPK
jgi:uracil-DNA glycosylase